MILSCSYHSAAAFVDHFSRRISTPPPSSSSPRWTTEEKAITTTTSTALFAKKKKKKKKGGAKNNQSGFKWASSFTLKPFEAQKTREIVTTAATVFQKRVGSSLIPEESKSPNVPKELWTSPIACLIMSSEGTVAYANVAALETVGLGPDEFEQLFQTSDNNSSGEENNNNKIDEMISIELPFEMKGESKYESGYQKKILKTKNTGDDVTILNAKRWALENSIIEEGKFVTTSLGVAYAWEEWMLGDNDAICTPGGNQRQLNMGKLEEAIAEQAETIRELKEVQGLGNKDPMVVKEVQQLLQLKDQLATMKE